MSKSLDTNILLRWLLDDVPEQTQLVDQLFSTGEKFHIADLVFIEVAYVLEGVYEMSKTRVAENIRLIISNASFICNRKLFDMALPSYVKHSKLSFADCCLVASAELNEAVPLLTFDRKLARQLSGASLLVGG